MMLKNFEGGYKILRSRPERLKVKEYNHNYIIYYLHSCYKTNRFREAKEFADIILNDYSEYKFQAYNAFIIKVMLINAKINHTIKNY